MKIRLVGAELFHADGRTDVTKLIVAFRSFSNAPENGPFRVRRDDSSQVRYQDFVWDLFWMWEYCPSENFPTRQTVT